MEFSRNCPNCNKLIYYKNKYNLKNSEKRKALCKSCAIKRRITEEDRLLMSERIKGENNPMYGKIKEKNPFYKKIHTVETKEKIRQKAKGRIVSEDTRKKLSTINSGKNNPMFNKTFYKIWEEKYGKELAIQKYKEWKEKISKTNSGENNPMYGKPAPIKSGNGWSGWYKGWYFRSLRELSYMINVIEKLNLNWKCAEKSCYAIPYFYNNKNRNYYADFILNDKYLIEIKPKTLWETDLNKNKRKFALKFCKENNLVYKIRDPKLINTEILIKLYNQSTLYFVDRWDKKFKNILHKLAHEQYKEL